jgi:hypothetical protein
MQIAVKKRAMLSECIRLSATQLFKLWWISRRHTDPRVHIINNLAIRKELRSRGFMCLPEKPLVLSIPPSARLGKREIVRSVKQMFSSSYLDSPIAMSLMWTLSIVYQATQCLGTALDSTKEWIRRIEGGKLPCKCHLYPHHWPRRHGHLFIPSWAYEGPYKVTMQGVMQAQIREQYNPCDLRKTLATFWKKYLPDQLMGEIRVPECAGVKQAGPYSMGEVKKLRTYLQELVVMGIDKCKGRKLILCPALFAKRYGVTFPVRTDTVHFEIVNHTTDSYSRWLQAEFRRRKWLQIATFFKSGQPPVPYPLLKLKDIIANCKTVQASKGVCCRCRPISPNTKHWLRRVYRRIGAVLRIVCLNIPTDHLNFMRSQSMLTFVHEWNGSRQGKGEWMLFTGDIANCYDELIHQSCIDGVRWGLSQLASWLGKRKIGRFSVSKYDRRDCRPYARFHDEDMVHITIDQVMEVCQFDCENAILEVEDSLYRRKLGAPMGGFLSAFYAMLCFAYIEYKSVTPLFKLMGVPGGIKRYLDDVIVAMYCRSESEVILANSFMQMLGGESVYKPPLKLNLEPRGDQDILEARVFQGEELSMMLNNKVATDIAAGIPPYRQRIPQANTVPRRTLRAMVGNLILRCIQSATSGAMLARSLVEARQEVVAALKSDALFNEAVRKATVLVTNQEKERKRQRRSQEQRHRGVRFARLGP